MNVILLANLLAAERAQVRAAAPALKKVAAAPVVGFFLDHGNLAGSTGVSGPNTQPWSNISSHTAATYTTWMKYAYTMQNMTFGRVTSVMHNMFVGLSTA